MIKYLLLFFVFISLHKKSTKAQNVPSAFILEGKINAREGKIRLIPLSSDFFHPGFNSDHETEVHNGNFIFKDSIYYPYPFEVLFENKLDKRGFLSGIFFIDPGIQHIVCNKDSMHEIPDLGNKTMQELRGPYSRAISSAGNNSTSKSDSVLFQYTKTHPNSFVALWKLIFATSERYSPIFDSIYSRFSPSIKSTYAWNILGKRLANVRTISIGKIFPRLLLRDIKDLKELKPITGFKKYTLIDFWFAHCSVCLSQFPKLKTIYSTYSAKGFNIVGISVDKKEMINDWEKVIKEQTLPWTQYLDMNDKETQNLSINGFPTNFLLDESGKIIKRDIEPNQLATFLKKNLK
jgi:thiol-disulfide isomerase/thioredoxin